MLTWRQMVPQILEPKVASALEVEEDERVLPKPGAVKVPPTFEDRMAIRMEDCDRCLVKDNRTTLFGERAQTDEGMEK
jgi:hypothetical protein